MIKEKLPQNVSINDANKTPAIHAPTAIGILLNLFCGINLINKKVINANQAKTTSAIENNPSTSDSRNRLFIHLKITSVNVIPKPTAESTLHN
ncbi:hypothetical protein D3C75_749240 [compost metagenome]